MSRAVYRQLHRAKRRAVHDLRADPYLPYILVLAAVFSGFWFWHRIPNFATRDERDRLFDVLAVVGSLVEDPSFGSLKEGITYGRAPYGAVSYLFALAALPVVVVAFLTGQLDVFAEFDQPNPAFGGWPTWHATPEWVWTWSLLLIRLLNVVFAVGCVYLTYRLGAAIRDRTAGRLGALMLTLTFGFLTLAHEGGEDMPALFFTLLAIYLALRYVQHGRGDSFLTASGFGGLAIAFKLTAAPVVIAIGVAHVLRGHATEDWRRALVRPRLLITGATLGAVTIVLGFPSALVTGPAPLEERFIDHSTARVSQATGPDAPIWWWFLRGYFNAFGLPLFIGIVSGVAASFVHFRDRATSSHGLILVGVSAVSYVALISRLHDFRVHHLLVTFPLLIVVFAVVLSRTYDRSPSIARPLIGLLVMTSGAYAIVGDVGYATQPREQATAWLDTNAAPGERMGVLGRDLQDTAVPHDMALRRFWDRGRPGTFVSCPAYIQLGYRDLLYLNSESYYRHDQQRAARVRSLINGEYSYEIAAEFGRRPPNFVPQRPTPGSLIDLIPVGLVPRVSQYGDEQDVGPNQYTLILERTAPCG